jgi:hypothetical protein
LRPKKYYQRPKHDCFSEPSNVSQAHAASTHHPETIKADASDLVAEEHQQSVVGVEHSHSSMIVLYHKQNAIFHLYLGKKRTDWSVASVADDAWHGLR